MRDGIYVQELGMAEVELANIRNPTDRALQASPPKYGHRQDGPATSIYLGLRN